MKRYSQIEIRACLTPYAESSLFSGGAANEGLCAGSGRGGGESKFRDLGEGENLKQHLVNKHFVLTVGGWRWTGSFANHL